MGAAVRIPACQDSDIRMVSECGVPQAALVGIRHHALVQEPVISGRVFVRHSGFDSHRFFRISSQAKQGGQSEYPCAAARLSLPRTA